MSPTLPTDEDILAETREWSRESMTYVIKNRLRSRGFRVETRWVLRQMKRLECTGKVQRVSSPYAVQICWRVAP